MGGAASPSPYTESVQHIQGGWIANPTARAIGLPILKQMASYNTGLMNTAIGANKGDPASLAKFYGLPPNASTSDIVSAIGQANRGTQGVVPGIQQQPIAPTRSAARGGLMSLRGYATGGNVQDLTPAQRQAVAAFNATIAGGGKPTDAQIAQINRIEQTTGRNVSPYTNTGTAAVGAPKLQEAIANAAASGNYPTGAGPSPAASISEKYPDSAAAQTIATSPSQTSIGNAMQNVGGNINTALTDKTYGVQPILDANGKPTGQIEFTDPNFNKAVGSVDQLSQGTGMFGSAVNQMGGIMGGLEAKANYTPQQVAAQQAAASQASAQQGSAQQASSQGYSASNMSAPEAAKVQDYTAAQADVNQMKQPKDVTTEATKEQQMTGPAAVQAKALQNFQMQGPGSWTDPGVSQKYMDPYKQGVIDIAKRQKDVDYQKQMAGINAQAASAGAFGGARQAMERSQASKDYQQQLQDLETQGMSQAYQSGMGQYSAESGLGQQANIQNLQAMLGVQQTGSAQDLQAALANQGMDYNTAMQNLQARMGTQQFNANQNLQGQLANQQAGLTTGQANLGAAQQTSLANQAALNQQQQQYVQNALDAAKTNYGGQLTAAQQNQIAQNAASQFTAAAGNTASLTNAQLGTQASLTNAQLGTQAAMQNASLGTQASLANAQNALQASMANQQAGLTANQQGIGALSNAGQFGMGMGNLGLNTAQLYGNAAQYTTNQGQQYLNNLQQTELNKLQFPNTVGNWTLGSLSGAAGGSQAGNQITTGSQTSK